MLGTFTCIRANVCHNVLQQQCLLAMSVFRVMGVNLVKSMQLLAPAAMLDFSFIITRV